MPRRTKRSRQSTRVGTVAANHKRARNPSPPAPQPELQLQVPIGFDNPSTGSETERRGGEDDTQASALAEAVASEERPRRFHQRAVVA